jgi:hypothetical protein
MNILLSCFFINLPSNFHKVVADPAPGKENEPELNKKKGGKQKGDRKDDIGGKRENNKHINNDQVPKIKIMDVETWEKMIQIKCVHKHVRWNSTFMCPCWHIKGYCWKEGCKFMKTHVPTGEVPSNKKAEHLQYLAC